MLDVYASPVSEDREPLPVEEHGYAAELPSDAEITFVASLTREESELTERDSLPEEEHSSHAWLV